MLSKEVLQHCARCGSCTVVCPTYEATGRESLTARGKLHLLGTGLAENPSANYQDLFGACLLCGACEQACPRDIDIRELVVEARSRFPYLYGRHGVQKSIVRTALSHPGLLEGLVRAGINLKSLSILPAHSGLRLRLGLLEKDRKITGPSSAAELSSDEDKDKPVHYFTGCLARYLQPSVAAATIDLCRELTGSDVGLPEAQVCCGLAAWSSGRIEEARRLARKNIAAFAESTGPVIASCASCSSFLQTYPKLFAGDPEWHDKAVSFCSRVKEFSTFFLQAVRKGQLRPKQETRLYYHEPCHLRFDAANRQATRQLLDRLSGTTRLDQEDKQHCCGQGGLFHIGYPELSERIFSRTYANVQAEKSAVIVTTCSGCLMQWQSGLALRHSKTTAMHLAVFLADCLAGGS